MKKILLIAALLVSANALAYDNGYRYGGNYRSSEYSYRLTNPSTNGYVNADVSQPSYAKRQLARDMDALEVRSAIRNYESTYGRDSGYGSRYYQE